MPRATDRPTAVRRRVQRGVLVSLLALLPAGCHSPADSLAHARPSPDALAESALEAIADQDEERLRALMITREEYESHLWPILPDHNQMPFGFAWSITEPRSRKARRNVISAFGGLPLELVRVELGQDVEEYDEFALYRRSRMIVRRTDTGAEGVLPLMDTLVHIRGGWKFMNFVDSVRQITVAEPPSPRS